MDWSLILIAGQLYGALNDLGVDEEGYGKCFCGISKGNPMVTSHSDSCKKANGAIKLFDKYMKDNDV